MKGVVVAVFVVVALIASSLATIALPSSSLRLRRGRDTITCGEVIEYLKPCEEYLKAASGAKPSEECCNGANALKTAATTPQDKKTACECIKTVAEAIKPNPQNAHDLPSNCGISLPFDISPDIDCSKIGYVESQK